MPVQPCGNGDSHASCALSKNQALRAILSAIKAVSMPLLDSNPRTLVRLFAMSQNRG